MWQDAFVSGQDVSYQSLFLGDPMRCRRNSAYRLSSLRPPSGISGVDSRASLGFSLYCSNRARPLSSHRGSDAGLALGLITLSGIRVTPGELDSFGADVGLIDLGLVVRPTGIGEAYLGRDTGRIRGLSTWVSLYLQLDVSE